MQVFKGQALLPVPRIVTYIELRYIRYFNMVECHHYGGMVCALWSLMVLYNALKGFPNVPCGVSMAFSDLKPLFLKATVDIRHHPKLSGMKGGVDVVAAVGDSSGSLQ